MCLDNAFSKARLVDVGIALGYFVLIAQSFGLSTCPIGLINAYEDDIKELLDIPDNKDVVIGIALGYADEEKQRLSRRLIKAYREKQISCSPGNVKPLSETFSKRGVESFQLMNPYLAKIGQDFNCFVNEGS